MDSQSSKERTLNFQRMESATRMWDEDFVESPAVNKRMIKSTRSSGMATAVPFWSAGGRDLPGQTNLGLDISEEYQRGVQLIRPNHDGTWTPSSSSRGSAASGAASLHRKGISTGATAVFKAVGRGHRQREGSPASGGDTREHSKVWTRGARGAFRPTDEDQDRFQQAVSRRTRRHTAGSVASGMRSQSDAPSKPSGRSSELSDMYVGEYLSDWLEPGGSSDEGNVSARYASRAQDQGGKHSPVRAPSVVRQFLVATEATPRPKGMIRVEHGMSVQAVIAGCASHYGDQANM